MAERAAAGKATSQNPQSDKKLLPFPDSPPPATQIDSEEPVAIEEPPPPTPEAKTEEAIRVLQDFFKEVDPGKKRAFVIGKRNRLNLEQHYEVHGGTDPKDLHGFEVSSMLFKRREILVATFKDESGKKWAAPLEWNGNRYLLHWGSMTAFGELPWQSFLSEMPSSPLRMRCRIWIPERSKEPRNENDYVAVLLSHPDGDKPVRALIAPNESNQPLFSLAQNRLNPVHLTIAWEYVDSVGLIPVIQGVLALNWID